jgi:hypothetical protein
MVRSAIAGFTVWAMFSTLHPAHAATSADTRACGAAIDLFERSDRLPLQMLNAIGIVESGRINPQTGVVAPWPWAINIAGKGYMFDTAAAAIAAVQAAQAAGIQSIDVGCMQVNLFYHAHAFANLEEAFDPIANVRYAAKFLLQLRAQMGGWASAVAAYHSATPAFGTSYARVVAAIWPLATQYGLSRQDRYASTSACPDVDPDHVLTPEFRAQVQAAAAFRCQHEKGMTCQISLSQIAAHGRGAYPDPTRGGAKRSESLPSRSALEAEVDPTGTLTPEFRAQMVRAAAFRHKMALGE